LEQRAKKPNPRRPRSGLTSTAWRGRLDLIHGALSRRFVGPPAQKFGSVAKPMSGKMVVLNFDHELGLERLPLRRTTGGPSARASRRVAGESGWRDESFHLASERLLVAAANGRGETNVMQKAVIAIEPEQERTDHRFAFVVAKPADDTVRAAVVLDFLHSAALARAIVEIAALGDDAVEHGADILKTALGLAQLGGGGGQSN